MTRLRLNLLAKRSLHSKDTGEQVRDRRLPKPSSAYGEDWRNLACTTQPRCDAHHHPNTARHWVRVSVAPRRFLGHRRWKGLRKHKRSNGRGRIVQARFEQAHPNNYIMFNKEKHPEMINVLSPGLHWNTGGSSAKAQRVKNMSI